jgi:D-alanyl-D-alanine carboxypeptidase
MRTTPLRLAPLVGTIALAFAAAVLVTHASPTGRRASPSRPAAPRLQESPLAIIDGRVTRVVREVLSTSRVAGISVAVGRSNTIWFAKGFGVADRATGKPLDAASVMDIGSIGKQVTAAAVLKLVDQRRVDLDQPLTSYLPSWNDGGRGITVRQLLHHTSGLQDPPFSEDKPEPRFLKPVAAQDFLAFLGTAPFRYRPQETWQYANTGYQLLGLMLERLHGRPYGRVIEDEIARPAGLKTLVHCDKARPIANRVRDYVVSGKKVAPIPPLDVSWFGGAGSLCATASDLVRWEQALWGGKIVSAVSRGMMHEAARISTDKAADGVLYGFGRELGSLHGHSKIAHPGTGAGISAILSHYPDDNLVIAVLANTNGGDVPHARDIEARLAPALLALPAHDHPPDVPLTAAQIAAWTGAYFSGSYATRELRFTSCGVSALCVAEGKATRPLRLRHRGYGVFAGPDGPESELRFAPANSRAEWVVHTLHGVHEDVLRRIN